MWLTDRLISSHQETLKAAKCQETVLPPGVKCDTSRIPTKRPSGKGKTSGSGVGREGLAGRPGDGAAEGQAGGGSRKERRIRLGTKAADLFAKLHMSLSANSRS